MHPYSTLNCLQDNTIAFAGKSKIPTTNFAFMHKLIPVGKVIVIPSLDKHSSILHKGLKRSLIGGLLGPTHTPANIFFASERTDGWRLNTAKYIRHKLVFDDLYIGTPSRRVIRLCGFFVRKNHISSIPNVTYKSSCWSFVQ